MRGGNAFAVVLVGLVLWAWQPLAAGGGGEKKEESKVSAEIPKEPAAITQKQRVFTETETQILLELDKQRIELERRMQAVELREKLVDLMEQRLNARVGELEKLKVDLEGLLKSLSGKDDKELDQLSAIYGAMKPTTAASVLNRLDNAIVLDVLMRMPVKKSGKIMESLEPAKARVLSAMMAARTQLPEAKGNEE